MNAIKPVNGLCAHTIRVVSASYETYHGGRVDVPASSAKFWFSATSIFVGFAPNRSTPQKHADATKTKPTADSVTPRVQASNLGEEAKQEREIGRVSKVENGGGGC